MPTHPNNISQLQLGGGYRFVTPPRKHHDSAIAKLLSNPENVLFVPPFQHEWEAKDAEARRLTQTASQEKGEALQGVIETESGEFVGIGGFREVSPLGAEIGWIFPPEFRRKGIATMLLHALTSVAFGGGGEDDGLGVARIFGRTLPENKAMVSFFAKHGFSRLEGVLEGGWVEFELERKLAKFPVNKRIRITKMWAGFQKKLSKAGRRARTQKALDAINKRRAAAAKLELEAVSRACDDHGAPKHEVVAIKEEVAE